MCAKLHNICIEDNIIFDDEMDEMNNDNNEIEVHMYENEPTAQRMRAALIQRF